MIKSFRLNAATRQLFCINTEHVIHTIELKSFLRYMPFQWDGDIKVFDYPSLKGLFIDILNEVRLASPDLFTKKEYTIKYKYNGKPSKQSFDTFVEGRQAFIKMLKRNIYTNLSANFNINLHE